MTVSVKGLHPTFVGEVSGLDLADPTSDAHYPALQEAMDRHRVLVFHGTPMSQERQIEWASQFGTLEGKGQNVNIVMQGKMRISQQLADMLFPPLEITLHSGRLKNRAQPQILCVQRIRQHE